ncbi:MAG: permease [Candidatus Aminicenantales bacterium]
MKKILSSKNLLLLLAGANIILYIFDRPKASSVLLNSKTYLLEMLSGLPPILILIGLFQAWVSRKTVEKAIGGSSGLKGILMAVFVGTAAMGPLYAAFPLGVSLLEKGASLFNTAIFLCVWASIKIPMILFEIKFLGPNFAGLRLALTLPSIIVISFFLNAILKGRNFYERTETS